MHLVLGEYKMCCIGEYYKVTVKRYEVHSIIFYTRIVCCLRVLKSTV